LRDLARDLDEMVARLEALVATQRRFVSDAAHELRAPLTAMRGELELALRRSRSSEADRAALGRALGGGVALGETVNDLLALARARTAPADAGPSSLREALARACTAVEPTARGRGVELHVDVDDTPAVGVAPGHLQSVVRNLLENAARHAP